MIKKIFIILSLMLLLTPVFARGVAEEVSESGVHGLFSLVREAVGLKDLDKKEEASVKEVPVEEVPVEEVPLFEDKPLITKSFSYRDFEFKAEGYSTHAVFSVDDENENSSDSKLLLTYFLVTMEEETGLSYESKGSTQQLYYPVQTEESLESYWKQFCEALKQFIDYYCADDTTVEEEEALTADEAQTPSPVTETTLADSESEGVVTDDGAEKPYRVSFSYRGIKTDIEGYLSYTNVYIPLGVTQSDVEGVVAFMLKKDPSFLLSSFKIDGAKVVFSYSSQSADRIIETISAFQEYLKAYIDSIFDVASVESAPKKSSSSIIDALKFTFGIDAGVRGKFRYEKGTAHIFPTATARVDLIMYSCFFIEANAEIMAYRSDSYFLLVGAADALLGVRIGNDSFNFFGFGGVRYTVSTKNSGFKSGLEKVYGGGITLGIGKYFDIKGLYEHFNDTDYFNVSLGVRF